MWRRSNPNNDRSTKRSPSPRTSTHSTEPVLEQLQLETFNAQCMEHNRQFLQLLDEALAGPRARQDRFSAFLLNVRTTFDSAQEKRHEQWRTLQKDMREYAVKLHESVSARAEGYRDGAAAEGLASCRERAEHFRGQFNATLHAVETSTHNFVLLRVRSAGLNLEDDVEKAFYDFKKIVRSTLEASSTIRLSSTQDLFPRSSGDMTGFLPRSSDLVLPHLVAATVSDMDVLNNIAAPNTGNTHSFDDAFVRLQSQREAIWKKLLGRSFDASVTVWRTAFEALASELRGEFLKHPCMNEGIHDNVIAAPIMIVPFRAAESRRILDMQRVWEYHMEQLNSACTRLMQDLPFRERSEGTSRRDRTSSERGRPARRDPGRISGWIPAPIVGGYNEDGRRWSFEGLSARNLLRPPHIAESLPVVSSKKPLHHDIFRQQQQERDRDFETSQSQRRIEVQGLENMQKAAFDDEEALQKTQASEAERRRSSEFALALNRVLASHEADISHNCDKLSRTLEDAFADAQRTRERTFQRALAELNIGLLSACERFTDALTALSNSDVKAGKQRRRREAKERD